MSGASFGAADQQAGFRLPALPPPLQAALQHAGSLHREGEKGLTHLHGALSTHISSLQANVDSLRAELGKTVAHAVTRVQQQQARQQQARQLGLGFASLSLASTGRPRSTWQPVADVAMQPAEVAARLNKVPVYVVINKKNDFILVTGEGPDKKLGLFFFSEADANALISKIEEQDPKLGRQAQVLRTSMDQLYKFTLSAGVKRYEGATFRFMPAAAEVQNAVQVYQDAGLKVDSFVGVPLFQVEGLNVTTAQARYTPLFFSKDDLDRAVVHSADERESKATALLTQRREKAEAELEKAKEELNNAVAAEDARGQRRAEWKINRAAAKASKAATKLAEVKRKSKPKIEVGSLEEVIAHMEMDTTNQWGDVVFIPSGSLSPANLNQIEKEEAAGAT